MRRWWVVSCLAIGCGRLGFHDASDAGSGAAAVRSTLALDRIDPGEVLGDFPLLVVLDDTRADRTVIDATASNVRFLDDGGNVLAAEIEQPGSAGGPPLVAWVRVPQISALTTTVTVEYGGALPAASTASVWSSAYVAVYHFGEPIDPKDATPLHHDGMSLGSTSVPGFLARGRAFDFTQQESVRIADAPDLALPVATISGMIYETQLASPYPFAAMASRDNTGGALDFWLGESSAQYAIISVAPGAQTKMYGNTATAGVWTHVVLTASGTDLELYVDGLRRNAIASGPLPHSPNPIYFGARSQDSAGAVDDFFDGIIDEVRFENVVRSAAWIEYDDLSVRDQLITYGPVVHEQ